MRFTLATLAALALTMGGCDKKDAGGDRKTEAKKEAPKKGDAKQAEPKKEEAPPAPVSVAWVKVDKHGIQVEHRAGATVADAAGESVMISDPKGECTLILGPVTEMTGHSDYDGTIAEIEKGLTGKKKEMLKNEKTGTGWVIHYTKESMMDPTKEQHAVDVRTKVGDKEFSCSRVTETAEDATCILKACGSIKAL